MLFKRTVSLLFVLLCLLQLGMAQPRFNPNNGHYYAVVSQRVNWGQAHSDALNSQLVANGLIYFGHLVTITSQEESDWVRDNLPDHNEAFIGLLQQSGSQEPAQGWIWVTQEPFAFINWSGGEPNNANGSEGVGNIYSNGLWNDANFNDPRPYIVEFEPVILRQVRLNTPQITGGGVLTGTVSLAISAPPGGVSVSLLDDSTDSATDSSVTIPGGEYQANFRITTKAVDAYRYVLVAARTGTSTASTSFTILPAQLSSLAVTPAAVFGGTAPAVSGKLTLDGKAGPGGVTITLSSNQTTVQVPGEIRVLPGQIAVTFPIVHALAPTPFTATLSASARGATKTASLDVRSVAITKVTLFPSAAVAGTRVDGLVTVNQPAPPGGWKIDLSSTSSQAILTANYVVVPEGAKQVAFSLTTSSDISVTEHPTISATFNGHSKTASFALVPVQVQSLAVSAASARKGETVVLTVTLNGTAPAAGAAVSFLLSNGAATMASSGVIAEGQTRGTFSVKANEVRVDKAVVIKASYHGVTKSITLTVKAG